ncbi:hypothetical protein UlMin_019270 [Ulmus minor]
MQLSPTTHSEKPLFIFKLFYFFQVGFTIFWRILTWNYPPPKWDYGGSALDCNKGNKRNWILVWEGGFFEFYKCEQASSGCIKGRFGVDVFFKMSHEVYNYGEGLVRKVATSNTHKWVFRDPSNEGDSSFIFSWNVSLEPQPRAWEFQFKTGIQQNETWGGGVNKRKKKKRGGLKRKFEQTIKVTGSNYPKLKYLKLLLNK